MARDQQIVKMGNGRWYVATLRGQEWHVPDGSGGWGYARTVTEAADIAIGAGASGYATRQDAAEAAEIERDYRKSRGFREENDDA